MTLSVIQHTSHTTYFSYNILLIKQCDFTLARCNNNAMYILQMPYAQPLAIGSWKVCQQLILWALALHSIKTRNSTVVQQSVSNSANHSRVEQVYEQDADDALSQHNCCIFHAHTVCSICSNRNLDWLTRTAVYRSWMRSASLWWRALRSASVTCSAHELSLQVLCFC